MPSPARAARSGSQLASPGTDAPKAFRTDIEGLRAVAVLAVVLFHAGIPGFTGGFIGVDVFFIISGFLITGMLWREAGPSGTVNLRRFWGARARRLLPASATVGVITMIVSVFALSPLQVKTVAIDAITSALYVSNYWFIASGLNYFGKDNLVSPSPFKHYWSLGVEEQFYLVWPVMIIIAAWLVRRTRRGGDRNGGTPSARPYIALLAIVVAASFALSLVLTYIQPYIAYLSLPTRAWQLAIGGLVALTAVHWRRLPPVPAAVLGWLGLAMILLSCLWLNAATEYPGTAALLPTLGSALVIGAGCADGSQGCSRVLSLSPMRAIGRISYSWYLWHWPVLVLVPVLLGHPLGLPLRLAAMGFSAGLAMLTLRYIENPLRFSDRIRRSPRNSLLMGGIATAAAVSVGVVALVGTPSPVGPGPAVPPLAFSAAPTPPGLPVGVYDSAVENVFAQVNSAVTAALGVTVVPSNLAPPLTGTAAELKSMDAGGCMRSRAFDSSQPECVTGNRSSPTTVALIGDSHASMWSPAVQQAVDQRDWRMLLMSKISCPIVDLPLTEHLNGWSEQLTPCAKWRSGIMARLRADPPQLVVVAALRGYSSQGIGIWDKPGFEPFNPGWIDGLAHLVHELRSYGSKVLVLGPEPKLTTVAPNCLSAHLENALACEATWPVGNNSGIEVESSVVGGNGGQYASTQELFCARNRCPAVVGNTMVFYDASHISSEYSLAMGPAIGALIDRALFQG
ncbi:MAG: acyltransferase family protein [Candidatus Nanopelagicales bacterium]